MQQSKIQYSTTVTTTMINWEIHITGAKGKSWMDNPANVKIKEGNKNNSNFPPLIKK